MKKTKVAIFLFFILSGFFICCSTLLAKINLDMFIDSDGDGLTDIEEAQDYGSNPFSYDSDNDGLNDKQEIMASTNPNKQDTDNDGVIDTKDKYPVDPNRSSASLMDSLAGLLNAGNSPYLAFGAPLFILFVFFLSNREKIKEKNN